MTRVTMLVLLAGSVLLAGAGCGGQKAAEGKMKVDSTEVFKNLKGTKSPPPKKPPG